MEPPRPKSRVSSLTILLTGLALYGIALFFPLLILILTYVLCKAAPYFYRLNDDGDTRRKMWKPWSLKDERPEIYKSDNMNKVVNLKESLWMNQR